MYTLGISCYYHDSAAALLRDGHVIAAVEEERFTRVKFDDSFPANAISWCLIDAGITPADVGTVAFYDKPVLKLERLLDNYITFAPRGLRSFLDVMPKWLHKRLWVKDEIKHSLPGFEGDIVFPEHHMSHAAYTFFTSAFDNAAILTIDGVGEWTTTSFGTGNDTTITLTHDIRWPHSIGLLYSAFTYHLGFKVNEGEYKLMGMASYGKPEYYDLILKELVDVKHDGSIRLNMRYFAFAHGRVMTTAAFSELFGVMPRRYNSEPQQVHFDMGASIQCVLEDILLKMVRHVHRETRQTNLCLGGGVALNGVANRRILQEGPFEQIHVPPSPGDAGSAVGCAQFAHFVHNGNKRHVTHDATAKIRENCYVGPHYSDEAIQAYLDSNGITYECIDRTALPEVAAELVSKHNVLGWYQGRMEWGPRALGNRSILADPRQAEMKDVLNKKIKHRESFRPFAPSVLEEHASEYFDIDMPSPYMSLVASVKKPKVIPAVTHVDGTARLQTVSRDANPLYYDLISEFYKITGVPVVINTSMNVMGEPIVNTPEQAHAILLNTEMDFLVMGNCLLGRDN